MRFRVREVLSLELGVGFRISVLGHGRLGGSRELMRDGSPSVTTPYNSTCIPPSSETPVRGARPFDEGSGFRASKP